MEKFQNSVVGYRLTTTLNSFRETVVKDYSLWHLGDAYYLRLLAGSFVPAVLISSIVSLGFSFNGVSIDEKHHDFLSLLFFIDSNSI